MEERADSRLNFDPFLVAEATDSGRAVPLLVVPRCLGHRRGPPFDRLGAAGLYYAPKSVKESRRPAPCGVAAGEAPHRLLKSAKEVLRIMWHGGVGELGSRFAKEALFFATLLGRSRWCRSNLMRKARYHTVQSPLAVLGAEALGGDLLHLSGGASHKALLVLRLWDGRESMSIQDRFGGFQSLRHAIACRSASISTEKSQWAGKVVLPAPVTP